RHLTVAWAGAVPTGTGHFTLSNMQGQAVWSVTKPSAPEVPLQLPELLPGVYALRVEVEGQIWVERVVIK
ncbi:MAG: T9SS type A sorting domain-containing protein, partial [Phaeodactylibacter sp.]|uniref:T9SS type A sorting domain-containing protein n=1 Tax=Phaeodactylibacter sp. TaxID=1940289 RepID=UPI0032EF32AA